ncbi:hypothetical protein HN011_004955, partial [Eciton burchellii]
GSKAGGSDPRNNFGNRDFDPTPFYNPNFEYYEPPMFGVHALLPSFCGRSSQHFRNERLRILPSPSPVQRRFTNYADGSAGFESRLPFSHVVDRFPRPFL